LTNGYEYFDPYLDLTVLDGEVEFSVAPDGGVGAGFTIANVVTNNPRGYKLSLESAGAELVCGAAAIPSVAADGVLVIDSGAGKHGAWGWNVVLPAAAGGSWTAGEPDAPSDWRAAPFGVEVVMVDADAASAVGGDEYGVYFGAVADFGQAACAGYAQSLVVSVVGNA
jgi:hypothetical protein